MKTVKKLASALYWISRVLSIMLIVVAIYQLAVGLLYLNNPSSNLPISSDVGGHFVIYLPFSRTAFLLGDLNPEYLWLSSLTVFSYGLLLFLLSSVMKAFMQEKLFTGRNVRSLDRFWIFNIVFPVAALIAVFITGTGMNDLVVIGLLHLVIAMFAFFMAAIFKQGLLLQDEQDLTF